MPRLIIAWAMALQIFMAVPCSSDEVGHPDFTRDVAPIFAKYCNGCHNASDAESHLVLETFEGLEKGGDRGAAIVPGRADASLMIRMLRGEVEPQMPPIDNRHPTEEEISILGAWIDSGAKGPNNAPPMIQEIAVPKIIPKVETIQTFASLDIAPDGSRLALGRERCVDVVDLPEGTVRWTSPPLEGLVNSVRFSKDGSLLVAASGVPGLYGMATVLRASDGSVVNRIRGHRDAMYDARFDSAGRSLVTCSYDRQIAFWNMASGELERTLGGHNGAVFELAFSADGSVLATASADSTVKIWQVSTGERLDTLGQAEGEQNAVAFSPDSRWIVAAGADRQLRMWQFLSHDRPQINPLKYARVAHNAAIVRLAFSNNGAWLATASESRELLLWDALALTPVHRYELQPDVISGLAFDSSDDQLYVARLNGSWQKYDVAKARIDAMQDEPSAETPVAEGGGDATLGTMSEFIEQEPNDDITTANQIAPHARIRGVIAAHGEGTAPDTDLFTFHARKNQSLVIEILAARNKSLLDSKLEVLDVAGRPIPRVLLQATRPSYFTFRGHNSTELNDFRLHGWQDMELNEYLYAQGEVTKLWMYPRGPDSGFIVYPGIGGDRYTYFGTSPIAHALNAPSYIVQPHPPGSQLLPNGLPIFTVYYENDDDGRRKGGADSRLQFTPPNDGVYSVRVSDVRSLGGDNFSYELTLRLAQPDFQIRIEASDLAIPAGSGKEFSVVVDRIDDFDGEIRIDIDGLPPGFYTSTPLVIQPGQNTAYGTLMADEHAAAPALDQVKSIMLTASATIDGKQVVKQAVGLGELKLVERPKFYVQVLPQGSETVVEPAFALGDSPCELSVAPGETIAAVLKVDRRDYDGEIVFGGDYAGRNLPHGVFVDNIGLNGLTLLQGECERVFFITAAKWVPETSRPFHLRAEVEGNPTSPPILLHVRP